MGRAFANDLAQYELAGAAEAYTGQFFDGSHKFDRAMQRAAFDWLGGCLRPTPGGLARSRD